MRIRFLEIAEIELDDAIQYYNYEAAGLGDDFLSELLDALDRIAKFPEAWHQCSKRTRRCQTRRFPYGIIYETRKEAMLTELLANIRLLYAAAPVKHVFNSGIEEFERWALHDGWIVEEGALVRVTPAPEEATGIRDKFLQDIVTSGLDGDGAIKTAVESSSKEFVAQPPDFNGSTTKAGIALETLARRAAAVIESKKSGDYTDYPWGKALQSLRSAGVIELQEEEILARVYKFISLGAHVPKGVTAEEWARLARTFGLSSAYFLLRKYAAF